MAENRQGLHHRVTVPALILGVREVDACQDGLRQVYSVKVRRPEMGDGRTHLDEDEHLISWFFDLLDLEADVVVSAYLVVDLSFRLSLSAELYAVPKRHTGFSPARSFMSENLEKVVSRR